MRIRLHGTPAENAAALAALAEVLDIRTVSRSYRDRPPSKLERVYIDAAPRVATESSQHDDASVTKSGRWGSGTWSRSWSELQGSSDSHDRGAMQCDHKDAGRQW